MGVFERLFGGKAAPLAKRSFDAATGNRGRGFKSFGPINAENSAAASTVRGRARHAYANNPLLKNAVDNWVGALAGYGITATSKSKDAIAAFKDWLPHADADSRTDWYGLQGEVCRTLVIDGECFIQILSGYHGPELRIIPSELIDESMTRELPNGGFIVSGVEFDSMGKRTAYHVLPHRPSQWATYAPPVRIEAEQILHVMKPIAAGQVRGISWLAPVMLQSNEFDQLLDALLVGTKVAAMHAGFLIDQNGSGEAYSGTESGGILETGIEPGTLKPLPSGLDVKFNSPAQAQEIGAFLRLNLQILAAGLGLPEHLLSGDLSNANYSSLRAGLLPFRTRVEQIQYGTLVPQFLNPVWRLINLDAPVEWLPPKPMQVDPLKDTQATVAELDAGLTSRRKAVAERGWDLDDLDAEIAAETKVSKPKEPDSASQAKKESEDDTEI